MKIGFSRSNLLSKSSHGDSSPYLISIMTRILAIFLLLIASVSAQTPTPPAPSPTPAWPSPDTPAAPITPRINSPSVFGVRPGSPFLYSIPATGDRPMAFAVEGLPDGLTLDAARGRITGSLAKSGSYKLTLIARNAKGDAKKAFKILWPRYLFLIF